MDDGADFLVGGDARPVAAEHAQEAKHAPRAFAFDGAVVNQPQKIGWISGPPAGLPVTLDSLCKAWPNGTKVGPCRMPVLGSEIAKFLPPLRPVDFNGDEPFLRVLVGAEFWKE